MTMNGKEFFDTFLNQKLSENPSLLAEAGLNSRAVSMDVEGPTGGQWTLSFDSEGMARVQPGLLSPECTILMNEKTFEGMIAGTLNVPLAVVMRKIKIKGDSGLAAKLGLAIKSATKA